MKTELGVGGVVGWGVGVGGEGWGWGGDSSLFFFLDVLFPSSVH